MSARPASSSASPDPFRDLQRAARAVARHLDPDRRAGRVVVFDAAGQKVADLAVGPCDTREDDPADGGGELPAGWRVSDSGATYDGRPVRVAVARLGLLRRLCEAGSPVPARELVNGWGAEPRQTSEDNVRFHVRKLNAEIRAGVPDLDFDPVEATGEGFRLVLR